MAKGFTQEYAIDYEVTFAPVARITSIRTLLAIAATRKWRLTQRDVNNDFLNGELEEEVYMCPPPGYTCQENKVCRLRKAFYGLKQAPRAWFAKFHKTITQLNFSSSDHDSALFTRKTDNGIIVLLLYVDDMIITGDDYVGIEELKKFLCQHFEMKDLGPLSYFVGFEVLSSSNGLFLSKAKFVFDLVSRAGLSDSKIEHTPLEPNVRFTPQDGTLINDATLYRQLVSSLICLIVTRSDISCDVNLVSQFMASPRTTHYDVVLQIIQYIKGTLFYGLHYLATSPFTLRAYFIRYIKGTL